MYVYIPPSLPAPSFLDPKLGSWAYLIQDKVIHNEFFFLMLIHMKVRILKKYKYIYNKFNITYNLPM